MTTCVPIGVSRDHSRVSEACKLARPSHCKTSSKNRFGKRDPRAVHSFTSLLQRFNDVATVMYSLSPGGRSVPAIKKQAEASGLP